MGILASIQRARNETYLQDGTWLSEALGAGAQNDSGVPISEKGAMRISTVYKCVDWRARMFGMLNKGIYERIDSFGRPSQKPAPQHYLNRLFAKSPNPTLTACAWTSMVSQDLHLYGNSYAWIQRGDMTGRVRYLWHIRPDCMRVEKDKTTGVLTYWVMTSGYLEIPFLADEILHIRGLGFDGTLGYSPIKMCINSLGWSAAAVRYGSRFFKQASRPSFIAISKTIIGDKARKDALIAALTRTGKDAGSGMLVEGDVDVKPLSMPQDEAQFIETIEYQETDVCGLMQVKPHEVGIMRNSTNNNIEQETISSVTRTISPLSVSFQQWCDLQLLSDQPSTGIGGGTETDRYFLYTDFSVLLRGDTAAQTAFIQAMIEKTVFSPNDACNFLGLPGYIGGDVRLVNRAYVPLDMLREVALSPTGGSNGSGGSGDQGDTKKKNETKAFSCYYAIVRDAVGRASARKSGKTEFVYNAFAPILEGVRHMMECSVTEQFKFDYMNQVGFRAETWAGDLDAVATTEMTHLIEALRG